MGRGKGCTGQAPVLDSSQIRRLLKICGTTNHCERDQTIVGLCHVWTAPVLQGLN